MKSILILSTAFTTTAAFTISSHKSTFTTSTATRSINSSSSAGSTTTTSTSLQMGLFDGVKDAFSAPALERSSLDADRETPIDRWMGWNVKPMPGATAAAGDMKGDVKSGVKAPVNFVDSMDAANYIAVSLPKPMGIVFEENDEKYGGIFVLSLKENGIAEQNGTLKPGDQLISVNDVKVSGLPFDDALGKIMDSMTEKTKLVFFRGGANMLYGPTGASKDWLDEFISKGGVQAN